MRLGAVASARNLRARLPEGSEVGVRRSAHKLLREKFQIAEDLLAGREWFLDHYTLPDAFFSGVFAVP
jgi:hypothetical protein